MGSEEKPLIDTACPKDAKKKKGKEEQRRKEQRNDRFNSIARVTVGKCECMCVCVYVCEYVRQNKQTKKVDQTEEKKKAHIQKKKKENTKNEKKKAVNYNLRSEER